MPSSFYNVELPNGRLVKENQDWSIKLPHSAEDSNQISNHQVLPSSQSMFKNETNSGKMTLKSNFVINRHQPYTLSKPVKQTNLDNPNTIFSRLTNISNSIKSIFIRPTKSSTLNENLMIKNSEKENYPEIKSILSNKNNDKEKNHKDLHDVKKVSFAFDPLPAPTTQKWT